MENALPAVVLAAVCLVPIALDWGTRDAQKTLMFGSPLLFALKLFSGGYESDQ